VVGMVPVQVARDLSDVLSSGGKVLGMSGIGARASVGNVEIGDVPVLDQTPDFGRHREAFELGTHDDRRPWEICQPQVAKEAVIQNSDVLDTALRSELLFGLVVAITPSRHRSHSSS